MSRLRSFILLSLFMCSMVGVSMLTERRVPRPVGGFDVFVSCAGHDFHVYVALEFVLVADGVHDLDEAFGGLGAVAGDAGAEEEAADGLAADEFGECPGEFVHLEGVALSGDPVAIGAVVAVHLAEVGEHDSHEVYALAVGHGGAIDAGDGVLPGRQGRGLCGRREFRAW